MLNHRANRASLSRTNRVATIAAALVLTILIAGFGAAQSFSSFSGSAFDPTNRPLSGVAIQLTNTATEAKYEVTSDRTGRFEFVGLPPGDYTWQAMLAGFATLKGHVAVSGTNVQHDLPLQVGSLEETITVNGGAPAFVASTNATAAEELARAARAFETRSACNPPDNATGGQIQPPTMISHARPVYPDYLNAAKVGGVVVLQAVIATDGTIRDVTVERAPHPDLGVAATDAVRQWQFTPTRLNCDPIEVNMKVTVYFSAE